MIASIYVHFFDLGMVRNTKITALCNYKLTYFCLSNNCIVLNNRGGWKLSHRKIDVLRVWNNPIGGKFK